MTALKWSTPPGKASSLWNTMSRVKSIWQQFPRVSHAPSHPAWCLLGRFPIQRKWLWISLLTHFLLLSGGTCQGCSALKFPLLGPEAPGTTNTSLHCLPASHFPVALMRQPCAHTIAYCGCLASHSLPHCRGLHTNNLLNLGPIEGDSSSHVQPVLLF